MLNCTTYFVLGLTAGAFAKKGKPLARAALKRGVHFVGTVQKKAIQLKEGAQDIIAEAKAENS